MSDERLQEIIRKNICTIDQSNKVVIWGKSRCPWCQKAVAHLNKHCIQFALFWVDRSPYEDYYCTGLKEVHNWSTFPQVIVNGECIGGFDSLSEYNMNDLK
jgi:glutaredoxin